MKDVIESEKGRESSAPYDVVLGIVLAIEGNVVAMVHWLAYPWNLVTYGVLGALTARVCASDGWLRNKLSGGQAAGASKA